MHLMQGCENGHTAAAAVAGIAMTPDELTRLRSGVLGISRKELAARSGVSESSLGRYERGEAPMPDYAALACTAAAFGLPAYSAELEPFARWHAKTQALPAYARIAVLGLAVAALAAKLGRDDPAAREALASLSLVLGGDLEAPPRG